jgi:hypothetical protein
LAETDFRKDDEAATIELTYSTPSGINRARPAPGGLIVRIIQVLISALTGTTSERRSTCGQV